MLTLSNLRVNDPEMRNEIVLYLRENPDGGVRERPEDQIALAQKTGLVLVIRQDSEICACSFVYKFDDGELFSEIGTMRVTENGLRLQQSLAQFHLVQMFLEDYYGPNKETFAVVKPGTASEHILRKYVAMRDWTPPPKLVELRAQAGVGFSSDKICLNADLGCIRKAFGDLKSEYQGGNVFSTPTGNEKLRVQMPWFNDSI